jgi:hypothetical protein
MKRKSAWSGVVALIFVRMLARCWNGRFRRPSEGKPRSPRQMTYAPPKGQSAGPPLRFGPGHHQPSKASNQ